MEITICKTAGLCAGAKRAYDGVIQSLRENPKTAVYKQILHNEALIADLKNKGAKFCNDLNEIEQGDFVVLRAHGEEKEVYDKLNEMGVPFVDTICVNVKRIHNLAIQKEKEGFCVVVLGNKKNGMIHDEVKGLLSFLNNKILVSDIEEAEQIVLDKDKKYFVLCQTTFDDFKFNKIVEILETKAQEVGVELKHQNTICNFTHYNKAVSLNLAKESDVAIVVGSKNSSNTVELYNTVKDSCYTIFSNDFEEIKKEVISFTKNNNILIDDLKICILAGASTLKENLQKLEIQLKFLLI